MSIETFPIDNLSGCWPWSSFMGCSPCGLRLSSFTATLPMCPQCGKRMHIFEVTEDEFTAWIERAGKFSKVMRDNFPEPNFDQLLRRAEHEISYSAKRSIEMYIPVWKQEPAFNLFLKCAFSLSLGEIEKCRYLMREYGMVEASGLGKLEPTKGGGFVIRSTVHGSEPDVK